MVNFCDNFQDLANGKVYSLWFYINSYAHNIIQRAGADTL